MDKILNNKTNKINIILLIIRIDYVKLFKKWRTIDHNFNKIKFNNMAKNCIKYSWAEYNF